MKLNENIQFNKEPAPQTVEKNIPFSDDQAFQPEVRTDFRVEEAANDGAKEMGKAEAEIFEDIKRREAEFKKQRGQFFADMKQQGK